MSFKLRNLLKSTTAQVAPFLCILLYANMARADCTVTSGGGTVADPNDNGVITCTTTGGDHTGVIGNYENNLTINLGASAVVNRGNTSGTITRTGSATITLQSGAQMVNISPTYSQVVRGLRAWDGGEGTPITHSFTLYDNAYIGSSDRAIYTMGRSDTYTETIIDLQGANSGIKLNRPQVSASKYEMLGGKYSSGGEDVVYNRNSSAGAGLLTLTLGGNNSYITGYQASIGNRGGSGTQTLITLSGDSASIVVDKGITTTGGETAYSTAGATSTVTLSGDNTSIHSRYSPAIALSHKINGYSGVSTVSLTGDDAHIIADDARSVVNVTGSGPYAAVNAVITLESNTSIENTAGEYGVYVWGGERGFGPYPTAAAPNAPTTITSAGTISAANKSLLLHSGDDVVTLQTGSNLSSSLGADAGDGTDALYLQGSGDEDEIFLNFETLDMDGTNWNLSGDSAIPTVSVNTGILNIDGTLTGAVTIAETGTLSGDGTITGNVSNTGAVLLDEINESLAIDGSFSQNSDDELTIYFDGVSNAVLNVTGTATIDGTLNLVEVSHGLAGGDTITVLNAGSVSGSFSTVNVTPATGSALTGASVSQVSNSLVVTFTGGATPASCITTSGTGTPGSPDDGDVITCTEPGGPHTTRIGDGTEGVAATVNIEPSTVMNVNDNATILIDNATVNIAENATISSAAAFGLIGAISSSNTAQLDLTLSSGASISSDASNVITVQNDIAGSPPSTFDISGSVSTNKYNSISLDDGDDTITLNTGASLSSPDGVDMGGGTDTLTLMGTGSEDEVFANVETLDMDGTDWTLTGSSNFTAINVNQGELTLNGTIGGATTTIDSGATLVADGTLTGNVANNGTFIAGGSDATGDVTINGEFISHVSGDDIAVTQINMDSSGVSTIDISGTNTIPGKLVFNELETGITDASSYTFMTTGGIVGMNVGDFYPSAAIEINPAPGSSIGYKIPVVEAINGGNDLQVTFNVAPCRVTSGSGTARALVSGDTVTCTSTNSPHLYKLGEATELLAATVNLQSNAQVSYTDPAPSLMSKYGGVQNATIGLTDATVTLGSGAQISGVDTGAIIAGYGNRYQAMMSVYSIKYGQEVESEAFPASQNVTLGDNAVISSGASGGEYGIGAMGLTTYSSHRDATTTVHLQGANSAIHAYPFMGTSTAVGTTTVCMLSDDCDDMDNVTQVTLSGNGSEIRAGNATTLAATGVGAYNMAMEYSYSGTGPSTETTVTLSGDSSLLHAQGLSSATAVTSGGETMFKAGTFDTTVTLEGAGAEIYALASSAHSQAFGVVSGASTKYAPVTNDINVTLSGANSALDITGGENAFGVYSKLSGMDGSSSSTIVTLSGSGAAISATRTDATGQAVGVYVGGEGGQGETRNLSAYLDVTLSAGTSITATDSGIFMNVNSTSQNPASSVDNSGTITGGAYSFYLADGDDLVTLRTGSALNSTYGAGGGDGTDTITLYGSATEDENFLAFESLQMNGTEWDLTGDSTFGSVVINTGTLRINGAVVADVAVGSSTVFGGSGTITGNVVNNGLMDPGNSVGTMTIDGDFTQGADDTLTIEFDGGGIDLLDISGTATVDGTLNLVELTAGTPSSTIYTFISSGTLVGEFPTINFTPASGSTLTHAFVRIVGNEMVVALMNCTTCSDESLMEYIEAEHDYRFCDGSYWQRIGDLNVSTDTCTVESDIEYDVTSFSYRFCNGTNWVPFYPHTTLEACSTAGILDYDYTNHYYKWCNGTNYIESINFCSGQ